MQRIVWNSLGICFQASDGCSFLLLRWPFSDDTCTHCLVIELRFLFFFHIEKDERNEKNSKLAIEFEITVILTRSLKEFEGFDWLKVVHPSFFRWKHKTGMNRILFYEIEFVCVIMRKRERNGIWRLGRVGGSMVGGEKMVLRGSDTNNCVGREKDGIGIVWIE